MKTKFAEYYKLSDERINEIWDSALIVFDTNVLLNLYRYPKDTCDEFLKVIEYYKERLWIPYQVGLEFHRRREDIIRKNIAAYKSLGEKLVEDLVKVVISLEGTYSRHPYINMKDIRRKVDRCAKTIAKSLEKQADNHPDLFKEDKILDIITRVFDKRVGVDFTIEELENIYQEGEKRYENKIPPGYCDEKNKKEKPKRNLYGDLIVWKQTMTQSKEKKKDVIFLTDDRKPDWWDKIEGKHSPRKELIKEFYTFTGQNILIYDSSQFLECAKGNKELQVSKKTIKEVEKVKIIDTWVTDKILDKVSNYHKYLKNYDKMSALFQNRQNSLYDSFLTSSNYGEFLDQFNKRASDINTFEYLKKVMQGINIPIEKMEKFQVNDLEKNEDSE